MKKPSKSLIIFIIIQILIAHYTIPFSINSRLFWLFPQGISFLIIGLALLTLKNWVRIINFSFSIIYLFIYASFFFKLLIIQGFIRDLTNSFLLMGITLHLPIIAFNIANIVFLNREVIRKQFEKGS